MAKDSCRKQSVEGLKKAKNASRRRNRKVRSLNTVRGEYPGVAKNLVEGLPVISNASEKSQTIVETRHKLLSVPNTESG